jgi:F0F1-type ATP synthase alpha subunit
MVSVKVHGYTVPDDCFYQCGEGFVGRVVNPLGQDLLTVKVTSVGVKYEMPLERKAPGVIYRQPVKEPLQTGIKAIDCDDSYRKGTAGVDHW